jgi:hypothetical protein
VEFKDRLLPEDIPSPLYTPGELDDKPFFFNEARQGYLETSKIRGRFEIAGQGAGFNYTGVSDQEAR